MGDRRTSASSIGGAGRKPGKRAILSCSECRRLKLKCDRNIPCGSCSKRGLSHLCPDGALAPTRTSKLAASATALAERVELLEQLLRQNGLGHTVPPLPEAANLGLDMMMKRRDQAAARDEGGAAVAGEGSSSHAQKSEEIEVEMLSMGVGSLTLRDDGSYRYLGPSAGMAFRGESGDDPGTPAPGTGASDGSLKPSPALEPLNLPASFPFLAVQTTIEDVQEALPAREEAVRVSKLYWDNCTFMFCPITDDDYWNDYLENAYSADPHGAKVACVCMVLALGVQFDPDVPPSATDIFERYYDLGQAALAVSRFLSHIAVIQALHLTGNVLLTRPKWRESGENFFPLFGIAVRGAQTMGLHRDPSAWGLDEAEVHRRRLAFWELLSLDRLQAFLSGRPYAIHAAHFDTQMPDGIADSTKERYRIAEFMAEAIDVLWSIKVPSYDVITTMDRKLRRQYMESPAGARCRALPPTAFSTPGAVPPPPPVQYDGDETTKRVQCEQHAYAMVYAAMLLYMHKGPFAQAIERYAEEPLQSPFAQSVRIIVLETTGYILKIARSWMSLDPILNPRWFNISLHLFVTGVSMSSLIVRSPSSTLASHAWDQLNEACSILESAAQSGNAPAAMLPRVLPLRQKAYDAIMSSRKITTELARSTKVKEDPDSTAADLLSLGTTTTLSRGRRPSALPSTAIGPLSGAAPLLAQISGVPLHQPPRDLPPPATATAGAFPSAVDPAGQASTASPASYLLLPSTAHASERFPLPLPANTIYEPYTQHLPYPPPHPAASFEPLYPMYQQQHQHPSHDPSAYPPYPYTHPPFDNAHAHQASSYPLEPAPHQPPPFAHYSAGPRGSLGGRSDRWGSEGDSGHREAARRSSVGQGHTSAEEWASSSHSGQDLTAPKPSKT